MTKTFDLKTIIFFSPFAEATIIDDVFEIDGFSQSIILPNYSSTVTRGIALDLERVLIDFNGIR